MGAVQIAQDNPAAGVIEHAGTEHGFLYVAAAAAAAAAAVVVAANAAS